jgi:hypothetical protein
MRRLTLILSDLYLPGEALAPSDEPDYVALPNLEWLLRFAQGRRVAGWRSVLAEASGNAALAHVAPAHFAAADRIPSERLATSWFAAPVHLEARLDHVRLAQRGLLRIAADERRAWSEEFARSFGPELVLHDDGPRGFLLSGLEAHDVISTDPARVLGADIAESLPRGRDVAPLRRLSAEIEMWLHAAPLNRERERARIPRISSLWVWGGGQGADVSAPPRRDDIEFTGEDSWLAALALAQTGADPHGTRLQYVQPGAAHGIVELTPMSDADGSLARLDAQWLAPARAALASGALEQVEILANDRHFITRRHAGWRFWRRGHHWMELLRRPHHARQA